MAQDASPIKLWPKIVRDELTPSKTRMQLFLEAKYPSPKSGIERTIEASYYHNFMDAVSWQLLPRKRRTQLSARSSMSKKRALDHFDLQQRELQIREERAR